jgi:hypothetical protein
LLAFVPGLFIVAKLQPAAPHSGRSAWFVGVLVLMVYLIFAAAAITPRVVTNAPTKKRASCGLSRRRRIR